MIASRNGGTQISTAFRSYSVTKKYLHCCHIHHQRLSLAVSSNLQSSKAESCMPQIATLHLLSLNNWPGKNAWPLSTRDGRDVFIVWKPSLPMIVNNREKRILRETMGFLSSGMSRPRGMDKGPFFAAECETNPTVQLSAEASGQNSTPLKHNAVITCHIVRQYQ